MKEVYIITKESGAWDSVYTVIHGAYLSLELAEKAKIQLEDKIKKLKSELKTQYYKAEFIYQNPDLEFHTVLIEKHKLWE